MSKLVKTSDELCFPQSVQIFKVLYLGFYKCRSCIVLHIPLFSRRLETRGGLGIILIQSGVIFFVGLPADLCMCNGKCY